ncbi:hypothetical protein PNBC_12875 [Paenibacillus crassostreae]|uniref:Uncharacterized protein n=1 Tax=Paenibacillus crassostreae TaxID=1763538 RepID=A0A167D938_9BACL|nr:DUF5693 family protein [Paenibacillus crassostreae]AOZ94726.1 hypothetical protein LPB68_14035 [Paenibacillus crassostreae]OAB74090.1 hypothetical protein PNBC_12875 [Paenibacillus crassostreae]
MVVQKWKQWSKSSRKWLWILVIVGIVAAIPVIYDRYQTETSANQVEFVFDYRDLVDIAAIQAHPNDYINEQLDRLKDAGVSTMAMFESTLDEFQKSRRITLYSSIDLAKQKNELIPVNENFTYVVFTNEENAREISPIIEQTFQMLEIEVKPWTYENQTGLMIETPMENAVLKPMQSDPITFNMLRSKGFIIMPRLADSLPYDPDYMESLISDYASEGVQRVLFEGESVKGYNDQAAQMSLNAFAELLKEHNIGIATIENLKAPQLGLKQLAYALDYNVVRLYSLSDADAALDVQKIADRFTLASKDRNIRMFYLNAAPSRNATKAMITDPMDNLIHSLVDPGNAIDKIESNGFTIGPAESFDVVDSSYQRIFKLIVVIGAVAFISLMISYFFPILTISAFILGVIGSAGLIVLKPTLFEQALALFVAISGPTIAMLLAVRKVNGLNLQAVEMKLSRRVMHAIVLYLKTAIISMSAIPFVVALLNNVTYQLMIEQFRGVSLLHFAPIALTGLYIVLYRGGNLRQQLGNILRSRITILGVIVVGVIGVVGWYYLQRTGNAGSVSSIELTFRSLMENTFGVRPRNKEFLLAHPIFLLGIFMSIKYRNAIYLMVIAVIGQLSMVDTFAHIHTPLTISLVRNLLGLGLGLIIGLIAIVAWQIIEGCWKRWSPRLTR